MSILVNKDTRLVVQGITGREGAFHTEQMLDYGTKVVAGVTPGKGGGWARGQRAGLRQRARRRSTPRAPTPASSTCRPSSRRTPSWRRPTPASTLDRLHHRGRSRAGHAEGARLPGSHRHAPDRPQLPRPDHPRRGQGGHHAGPHPHARARRRGQPLGHADL